MPEKGGLYEGRTCSPKLSRSERSPCFIMRLVRTTVRRQSGVCRPGATVPTLKLARTQLLRGQLPGLRLTSRD